MLCWVRISVSDKFSKRAAEPLAPKGSVHKVVLLKNWFQIYKNSLIKICFCPFKFSYVNDTTSKSSFWFTLYAVQKVEPCGITSCKFFTHSKFGLPKVWAFKCSVVEIFDFKQRAWFSFQAKLSCDAPIISSALIILYLFSIHFQRLKTWSCAKFLIQWLLAEAAEAAAAEAEAETPAPSLQPLSSNVEYDLPSRLISALCIKIPLFRGFVPTRGLSNGHFASIE